MQTLIWIIIIIVAILLIRLLRRWIKRLIFIAILLVLAFFIYGIFSPSGAGKLWYNIRTFPQRITSWVSNQNFIDYETYRLNSPKIGNKIESDLNDDTMDNDSNNDKDNANLEDTNSIEEDEIKMDKKEDTNHKSTIKAFPNIMKIPNTSDLIKKDKVNNIVTGYTKSDILGVINSYIDNHLDDDTDILVTVEFEESYNDPQKIILQTQPRIEE